MGYVIHPTCQIPGLDKIYEQVFGDHLPSFVEVGAFDGMTYSNTWGLANAGAKGLYIEAHPDFARQCIHIHQENLNIDVVHAACSDRNGKIDLIEYGEVSTTVLNKWTREWGLNEHTKKISVPCYTLETLLFTYKIAYFDLLVIDVEDAEIDVLKGFNLQGHLPKMIIIELHEGQGTGPDQKGWQTPWVDNYLKGYKKIYVDQINTIYTL